MNHQECGDMIFNPMVRLEAIAQGTGMKDLEMLFSYINHREIPQSQPTEDFCRELVTLLTGQKISSQDKKFLMAHLGLGEISADQKAGRIWLRPVAKGYPTLEIGAGQEETNINFSDTKYVAGRLILDFARNPYGINTIRYHGCKIDQQSKQRRLKIEHLPNITELFGVVTMEVKNL